MERDPLPVSLAVSSNPNSCLHPLSHILLVTVWNSVLFILHSAIMTTLDSARHLCPLQSSFQTLQVRMHTMFQCGGARINPSIQYRSGRLTLSNCTLIARCSFAPPDFLMVAMSRVANRMLERTQGMCMMIFMLGRQYLQVHGTLSSVNCELFRVRSTS